jgi:uncharacterized protein (DUF1800 family)
VLQCPPQPILSLLKIFCEIFLAHWIGMLRMFLFTRRAQDQHHLIVRRLPAFALACFAMLVEFGCAGITNQTAVLLTPGSPDVRLGDPPVQFTATVTGTKETTLSWSVNGVAGGNATTGTVSASGLYTPPAAVPADNVVTVEAALVEGPAISATSPVTLWNPLAIVSSVFPPTIGTGAFSITVTGSQFMNGATVLFGGTALTTIYVSATELTATGTASTAGTVVVTVENPNPGGSPSLTSASISVSAGQLVTPAAAVRFLEQSSFGPTPISVSQLEEIGFAAYLQNQFEAPLSSYPDPDSTVTSLTPTQQIFFTNALNNPDQLRQRVAFALSEIWVTSGFTIPPQGMAPYMRLLQQDAFGNYRTNIMYDVTLSPAMGAYLNMVNNNKPSSNPVTHANENYARELMQLFTIGLNQLNSDGSTVLDGTGNLIPTYSQADVQSFARAFTGWTYPTAPGATGHRNNPQYWLGSMIAFDSNHDMNAKTLLPVNGAAVTLPAGNSSIADLNGALDNIFAQPTLAPFISAQLIQHLVSSNPSPAYIGRVAAVFNSGTFSGAGATFGSGQRGDMQAVVAAILLDPEARRGDDPTAANPADGHLREPILYIASVLRAFGATSDGAGPVNFASSLSEPPLDSPSVFNFFPPGYAIPGTSTLGPEFDLQTTATALVRINFINSYVFGSIGSGTVVDFTPYASLATNPDDSGQLLDSLNALLLHGTMSASTRAAVLAAVNAVPAGGTQNLSRAKTAIYLILSSSQYQVEH